MARKLTIPYYRPTFVQKELSEVGDGTAFPMECTLDQVAEIFYRVKDAEWTSGGFDAVFDAGGSFGGPFYAPVLTPVGMRPIPLIEEIVSGSDVMQSQRGYSFKKSGTENTLIPANVASDPVGDFFGADYASGALDPADVWRDVLSDELGIWATPQNFGALLTGGGTMWFTGFSYIGYDNINSGPSYNFQVSDGSTAIVPCQSALFFSGLVAWVGPSIFDETTQYFIGVRFSLSAMRSAPFPGARSIWVDSLSTAPEIDPLVIGPNITLELSSGNVTFPTYVGTFADAISSDGVSSVTDFILTATEWWPYDDGAGNSVWDTATGARL